MTGSGQNCCVRIPVFVLQDFPAHIELTAYALKYTNLHVTCILATNMLVKNVTIRTRSVSGNVH